MSVAQLINASQHVLLEPPPDSTFPVSATNRIVQKQAEREDAGRKQAHMYSKTSYRETPHVVVPDPCFTWPNVFPMESVSRPARRADESIWHTTKDPQGLDDFGGNIPYFNLPLPKGVSALHTLPITPGLVHSVNMITG